MLFHPPCQDGETTTRCGSFQWLREAGMRVNPDATAPLRSNDASHMSTRPVHLIRLSTLGLIPVVLGTIAVLAATSGPNRAAVFSALERPATPAPAPPATKFVVDREGYSVQVKVSPNLASRPNRLLVTVTRHGQPVKVDRVGASFSMPAMNMWNALTSSLRSAQHGGYAGTEPVLGMAGLWQLRFTVVGPGGRRFTAAIDDRLRG